MSGETRRMLSLKRARLRLEVAVQRLLRDQQVRVDRRQVAQLGGVVAAHRVAALEPLGAEQVRQAVGEHVEVDARRRRGRGTRRCRRPPTRAPACRYSGFVEDAGEDQVGEDRLLLLPPRLAVVPGEAVDRLAVGRARAPSRRTSRRAAGRCRRPASASAIFLRQLDVLRRSGVRLLHAHQVPGDLQVVPDDGAVLLPAPRLVRAPVLVELLLHERAVVVVGEVLGDRVDGVDSRKSA